MKPRTMERLDLLAADAERRLLDDISRHQAALGQVQAQRDVLAAYRARLAQSWKGGAAVTAGQARSAGHFVAASQAAETQIDQMEARARQQPAARAWKTRCKKPRGLRNAASRPGASRPYHGARQAQGAASDHASPASPAR
jgi:flagellar biosynthesis chaperone FliJ